MHTKLSVENKMYEPYKYLQGESLGNKIWNRTLGILDPSNTTGRNSKGKFRFVLQNSYSKYYLNIKLLVLVLY